MMAFGVWARYAMDREGGLAAGAKRGEAPGVDRVAVLLGLPRRLTCVRQSAVGVLSANRSLHSSINSQKHCLLCIQIR